MISILIDHDIEGHAALLWTTLASEGWLEFGLLRLVTFGEAGLPINSKDREIWRFVQQNRMLLLTGNRNMDDDNSLEQTIQEENNADALPVLTISVRGRVIESDYRLKCATRIVEVVMYLDHHLGTGRLYIP